MIRNKKKSDASHSNHVLKINSTHNLNTQEQDETAQLFKSEVHHQSPEQLKSMEFSPNDSLNAQMRSLEFANKIQNHNTRQQNRGDLSPALTNESGSLDKTSRRMRDSKPDSQTLLERIKDGIERSDSTKRNKIEEILRSRIKEINNRSSQDQGSFSKSLRKDLRGLSKSRGSHRTLDKQVSRKSMRTNKSAAKRFYLSEETENQPIYYLSELANSLSSNLAEEIHQKIRESENYAYTEEEDIVENQDQMTKDEIYNKKFLSHYHHCLQSIAYISTLEKLNEDDFIEKKVYLPPKSHKWKKTLILDLDETLVHCDEDLSKPKQMQIPIKFTGGEIVDCGVTIRPFAKEFIALMSQFFEVVVFTASHSCYANMILNLLDPQNEFITYRMFRESCIETEEGIFVKDLRIFANRNIDDVFIVDNACYSYAFQISNGIPIVPFFFEKEDTQLIELSNFLLSMVGINNMDLTKIDSEVHHLLEAYFSQEENSEECLNVTKYQKILGPHRAEKKTLAQMIDFYFRGSAFDDFVTEYSNQASLHLQPVLIEFVEGLEALNSN